MINILLADDHAIIRAGLKIFIGNYIAHSVIYEAWDGDSAFEKVKERDYALIVLDINMPNTDSLGLVANIVAYKPGARILMFSMNAEQVYAKKFLQIGASGYVSKASAEAEIKMALDTVLKGKRYISPALSRALTDSALGDEPNNPFDGLSSREFEIASHLARGKSLSEICTTLSLQPSTVGTHKARIFEKLKCNNIIDIHELAKLYEVLPAN